MLCSLLYCYFNCVYWPVMGIYKYIFYSELYFDFLSGSFLLLCLPSRFRSQGFLSLFTFEVSPSRLLSLFTFEVSPSRLLSLFTFEVLPSRLLSLFTFEVLPSRLLSLFTLEISPSRLLLSFTFEVSPSRCYICLRGFALKVVLFCLAFEVSP